MLASQSDIEIEIDQDDDDDMIEKCEIEQS